jgi:hypothetical protein
MRALLAHPQYAFDCNRFLDKVAHPAISTLIGDIQRAVNENGDLNGTELLANLPLSEIYGPIVARLRVDADRFGFNLSEAETQKALRDFELYLKGGSVDARIQEILSEQESAELAGDMARWKALNEERKSLVARRKAAAAEARAEAEAASGDAATLETSRPGLAQTGMWAELGAGPPITEGGLPDPGSDHAPNAPAMGDSAPPAGGTPGLPDDPFSGEDWDEDFF